MMTAQGPPPIYVATQQVQPQMVTVQPPPAVITTASSELHNSGSWKSLISTGITQVVLGSLTAILGIVILSAPNQFDYFSDHGSPIWCGIGFYAVAGILGIVSGWKTNRGVATGYLVMSILACLASCCVIAYSSSAMARYTYHCYGLYWPDAHYSPYYYCHLKNAAFGVYSTLIVLGIVEFVMSIVGASMTYNVIYTRTLATHTVIQCPAQPQVLISTQQQGAMVYNSPVVQPQLAYQPQFANPLGQWQPAQYPEAQAPPTGENLRQPLII